MSKIEDGGYAFPCGSDDKSGWSAEYGMSLREWFAGQAINGLLASGQWNNSTDQAGLAEHIAGHAFAFADAMLAAQKAGAA